MKHKQLFMLLVIFLSGKSAAQNPNLFFAENMGGNNEEISNSIATMPSGDTYITGQFKDTTDMDPSAATANIISMGTEDIFVAKYDANGGYLWAFSIGSASSDIGNSISADAQGNVYVTGSFAGSADFDPSPNVALLVASGYSDIFVAKYSPAGNYLWAFNIGASDLDVGWAITTDVSGNCYVTGRFNNTVDFDPSASVSNLTSTAYRGFVAKYDGNGGFQWAFGLGFRGNAIKCDLSGNCYVTGTFSGIEDFDPGPSTANLNANSVSGIFVAKYSNAGVYQWAFNIPTTALEVSYGLALDASGNCFVTGAFIGTSDFDPSSNTATLTAPTPNADIFVAKYDAGGAYQWAFNMNCSFDGAGYGVSADPLGNCYVTGFVYGTSDFDPSALVYNLPNQSTQDAFVAKYTSGGSFVWAFNLGSPYSDIGKGISTDASGNAYVTGCFSTILDFDPGAPTYTLMITGGPFGPYDAFIAKYGSSQPSGIFENISGRNLSVYPNPSNGILVLEGNDISEVSILNSLGQTLLCPQLEGQKNIIDINEFSPGVYLVRLRQNDSVKTVRITKQ